MNNPKLRQIEAFPIENGLFCFRDPLGFTDKMVILGPEAVFVCSFLDGMHSLIDIGEKFIKTYGLSLSSDKINEILNQLDSCLFLENEHFFNARNLIISEFKAQKIRHAYHAGSAYESDPKKLKVYLDSLFMQDKGPGLPDFSLGSGRLCGLIAPHIDLHRGGTCFAHSYWELARESKADIYIILGIAHVPAEKTYVLTDKDFHTPLGTVFLNREIMDTLKKKCKHNFYTDEYLHRIEHSVEFQTLFLKYLYPERDITMVPVLCSSPYDSIRIGTSPNDEDQVKEFIDAFKNIVTKYGERLCVIAGVDFSHIGRRFGQDISITPQVISDLKKSDKAYLDIILKGDAEGFIQHVQEKKDGTNICGIPAIYTLLKIIEQKESVQLKYDQAIDDINHSIVSFAGVAFYR